MYSIVEDRFESGLSLRLPTKYSSRKILPKCIRNGPLLLVMFCAAPIDSHKLNIQLCDPVNSTFAASEKRRIDALRRDCTRSDNWKRRGSRRQKNNNFESWRKTYVASPHKPSVLWCESFRQNTAQLATIHYSTFSPISLLKRGGVAQSIYDKIKNKWKRSERENASRFRAVSGDKAGLPRCPPISRPKHQSTNEALRTSKRPSAPYFPHKDLVGNWNLLKIPNWKLLKNLTWHETKSASFIVSRSSILSPRKYQK